MPIINGAPSHFELRLTARIRNLENLDIRNGINLELRIKNHGPFHENPFADIK